MTGTGIKAEQSQVTRDKLIRLAHDGFISSGFDGLAMEGLVERAGVTRGALYHHFRDKRQLFEAVLTGIEQRIRQSIETRVAGAPNAWDRLAGTCEVMLDALADPGVQRVLLVEGKAVLGGEEWWRIHREHLFASLATSVTAVIEEGYIPSQPPEPLARLLWGAISEAAQLLAHAGDSGSSGTEVGACVMWLLHRLAD